MGFVNEKAEDGTWRTIDKERNIILSKVSGPDIEGNYQCELVMDGHIAKFYGVSGMKIHGMPKLGEKRQYEMNWKFHRVFIPSPLSSKKEDIKKYILEALKVYGDSFRTENAFSVTVDFNQNI